MSPLIVYKGGLLKVNGALATSQNCCCGDAAPCTCPEGLGNCYQIASYTDDFFNASGCSACTDCSSGYWDGIFDFRQFPTLCSWWGGQFCCIGGKYDGDALQMLELVSVEEPCYWEVKIYCGSRPTEVLIWHGTKTTEQTPVGTYTRIGGCDAGLGSLEIEECPA